MRNSTMRTHVLLAAFIFLFLHTTGVSAQPFAIETELLRPEASVGDGFGISIAMDHQTTAIGAWLTDENGVDSGAAYVYERGEFENPWNLTGSDTAEGDFFGMSVGIDADTAIVGARRNDGAGNGAGSAYIFDRHKGGSNNWGETMRLVGSDTDDLDAFGDSVAISGDTAVVAATFKFVRSGTWIGTVYVFERNHGGRNNWGEVAKLVASDSAGGDDFGRSIAINGDTLIVGASGIDRSAGAAYVFERNFGGANNWGEVLKLTAAETSSGDHFGNSVDISGDTIIVGAPLRQDVANSPAGGAAYIFDRDPADTTIWRETVKLTGADTAPGDYFGSVAIDGGTAIVGAYGNDDFGERTGSAYVFQRNLGGEDRWGELTKLVPFNASSESTFGMSVGIKDSTAVVGAPGTASGSGTAYAYSPVMIIGDTNGDGLVNLDDLNNVRNNFGSAGTNVVGDTNGDEKVDLQDLNNVRNHFGSSSVDNLAVVPEPNSVSLFILCFAFVWSIRRRRHHR